MHYVDDIDFEKSPLSTFKLKNNEDIQIIKYYKEKYDISISDTSQPLLVSKNKRNNTEVIKY